MQPMLLKKLTVLVTASCIATVVTQAPFVPPSRSTIESSPIVSHVSSNREMQPSPLSHKETQPRSLTLGESISQNHIPGQQNYDHIIEDLQILIRGRKTGVDLCAGSFFPVSSGSGYRGCAMARWDYFDEIHLILAWPLFVPAADESIVVSDRSQWRLLDTELDRLGESEESSGVKPHVAYFGSVAKGATRSRVELALGGVEGPSEPTDGLYPLLPFPAFPTDVHWKPTSSPSTIDFRVKLRENWSSEDPYLRNALSKYQCWQKLEEGVEVRADVDIPENNAVLIDVVPVDCEEEMTLVFRFHRSSSYWRQVNPPQRDWGNRPN